MTHLLNNADNGIAALINPPGARDLTRHRSIDGAFDSARVVVQLDERGRQIIQHLGEDGKCYIHVDRRIEDLSRGCVASVGAGLDDIEDESPTEPYKTYIITPLAEPISEGSADSGDLSAVVERLQ